MKQARGQARRRHRGGASRRLPRRQRAQTSPPGVTGPQGRPSQWPRGPARRARAPGPGPRPAPAAPPAADREGLQLPAALAAPAGSCSPLSLATSLPRVGGGACGPARSPRSAFLLRAREEEGGARWLRGGLDWPRGGAGGEEAGRGRGGGGAFPSPPRRREGAAAAGCEAAMRYGRGGAAGGSGAREAGAVGRVTGRGGPAGRQAGSWGGGPEAVGPAVGAGAGEVGVGGRGAGRGSPGRAAEVGCAGRAGGFAGGAAGDGGGGLRKARSVEQVHTWGDGAGELGGTPCCGVALEAEGDGNNLGVGSGKAGPALGWRGRGGGWPGAA